MQNEYHHNHYVPEWYQKLFIDSGRKDKVLYYLDLSPDSFIDKQGTAHPYKALRVTGTKQCFAQGDLYTARLGEIKSVEIEKIFLVK